MTKPYDPARGAAAQAAYRKRYPEKIKAYKKKAVAIRRAIVVEAMAGGCVDCGESDIRVLDFDHVRGEKDQEVAKLVAGYSIERLRAEIAKCEVRCANCHRKVTWERGWGYYPPRAV